jgi:hypothetical protein
MVDRVVDTLDTQRRSDPTGKHFIKPGYLDLKIALTGVNDVLEAILMHPKRPSTMVVAKLLDLDDVGLTESELKHIIAKCTCGLIMTRRMFHLHQCQRIEVTPRAANGLRMEPVVIDLTNEMDEA